VVAYWDRERAIAEAGPSVEDDRRFSRMSACAA
jgi:hypothetical protein